MINSTRTNSLWYERNTIGKDFVVILKLTFFLENKYVTSLSREIICQEKCIYIYTRSIKGIFPIFKEFLSTFVTGAEANESLTGEPITNSLSSSLSFAFHVVQRRNNDRPNGYLEAFLGSIHL